MNKFKILTEYYLNLRNNPLFVNNILSLIIATKFRPFKTSFAYKNF